MIGRILQGEKLGNTYMWVYCERNNFIRNIYAVKTLCKNLEFEGQAALSS